MLVVSGAAYNLLYESQNYYSIIEVSKNNPPALTDSADYTAGDASSGEQQTASRRRWVSLRIIWNDALFTQLSQPGAGSFMHFAGSQEIKDDDEEVGGGGARS